MRHFCRKHPDDIDIFLRREIAMDSAEKKMKGPMFFDSIAVAVDKERICRRLGYEKGATRLSETQEREAGRRIDEAFSLIQLKGSALILGLNECGRGKVVLENGIVFESADLSAMLKECGQVLLMGATAGSRIIPYIRGEAAKGDLSRAVIYDAAASEIVDSALDWLVSYFNQKLLRENKRVTPNRFSCGYGDFSLINQRKIHAALELEKIGVKITDSCILDPEKSVTAVAGIVSAAD